LVPFISVAYCSICRVDCKFARKKNYVANVNVYAFLFGDEACNRDIGEYSNLISLSSLTNKALILTIAVLAKHGAF
jgi:hypothetical protein